MPIYKEGILIAMTYELRFFDSHLGCMKLGWAVTMLSDVFWRDTNA